MKIRIENKKRIISYRVCCGERKCVPIVHTVIEYTHKEDTKGFEHYMHEKSVRLHLISKKFISNLIDQLWKEQPQQSCMPVCV